MTQAREVYRPGRRLLGSARVAEGVRYSMGEEMKRKLIDLLCPSSEVSAKLVVAKSRLMALRREYRRLDREGGDMGLRGAVRWNIGDSLHEIKLLKMLLRLCEKAEEFRGYNDHAIANGYGPFREVRL